MCFPSACMEITLFQKVQSPPVALGKEGRTTLIRTSACVCVCARSRERLFYIYRSWQQVLYSEEKLNWFFKKDVT